MLARRVNSVNKSLRASGGGYTTMMSFSPFNWYARTGSLSLSLARKFGIYWRAGDVYSRRGCAGRVKVLLEVSAREERAWENESARPWKKMPESCSSLGSCARQQRRPVFTTRREQRAPAPLLKSRYAHSDNHSGVYNSGGPRQR